MRLSAPSLPPNSDRDNPKLHPLLHGADVLLPLDPARTRRDLSPFAKLVGLAMCRRMRVFTLPDGRTVTATWVGRDRLALDTSLSVTTVKRARAELVKAGVLVKLDPEACALLGGVEGVHLPRQAVVFATSPPMAAVIPLRPGRWRGVVDADVDLEAGQDWRCLHPVHCTSRAGCARKTALEDGKRAARFAALASRA